MAQDELGQIRNLEDDNPRCQNCIDPVYMDDLGEGFYRCPVCGDEMDTRYPQNDPFGDDYEDEYDAMYDEGGQCQCGLCFCSQHTNSLICEDCRMGIHQG